MKKVINLGRITGKTPEFKLVGKKLQMKYDDEPDFRELVDFSLISSSIDLRLNQDTKCIEIKREGKDWETLIDVATLLEGGGGIKVVDTYADLPEDESDGALYYVANDSFGEDDWRQFEIPYTPTGETVEGISQISFGNSIEDIFDNFQKTLDSFEEVEYVGAVGAVLSNGNYLYGALLCYKMEGMDLKVVQLVESNEETEETGAIYVISNNAALFAEMMEMPLEFSDNVWAKVTIEYSMGEEDVEMNIITEELTEAPVFNIATLQLPVSSYDSSDDEELFYEDVIRDSSSLSKFDRMYNNVSLYITEYMMSFILANYAISMPRGLFICEDGLWKSLSGNQKPRVYELEDSSIGNLYIPNPKEGDKVVVQFPVIETSSGNGCTITQDTNGSLYVLYVGGYTGEENKKVSSFLMLGGAFVNEVSDEAFEKLNGKTIVIGGEPGYTSTKYGNAFCYIVVLDGVVVLSYGNEIKAVYFKDAGMTFEPSVFGVFGENNYYSFTAPEKGWYHMGPVPIKLNLTTLAIENLIGRNCSNESSRFVYIVDEISPFVPVDISESGDRISVSGLFAQRPGPNGWGSTYACAYLGSDCSINCQDYPIRTEVTYKNGKWSLHSNKVNRFIEANYHSHNNKSAIDKYTEDANNVLQAQVIDYTKAYDIENSTGDFEFVSPGNAHSYYYHTPVVPAYGSTAHSSDKLSNLVYRFVGDTMNEFGLRGTIQRNIEKCFYYTYEKVDLKALKDVLALEGTFTPTVSAFESCKNKAGILPFIDTSNITSSDDWTGLFIGFNSYINPIRDASNCTKFRRCFYQGSYTHFHLKIKSCDETEGAVYDLLGMFDWCDIKILILEFVDGYPHQEPVIRSSTINGMFDSLSRVQEIVFHYWNGIDTSLVTVLLDEDFNISKIGNLSHESVMHLIKMSTNMDGVSASVILGSTYYNRLTAADWEIINSKGISVVETK